MYRIDSAPVEPSACYDGAAMKITCCIRYTIDPHGLADFETYARRWPPIIARCQGELIGYFLPCEGANNFALALVAFDSLADYERYRERLAADPEACDNRAHAQRTRCILVEERTFLSAALPR
jgi:hypothetical protein